MFQADNLSKNISDKLKEISKPYYESLNDPSHDWGHINRVLSMALKFSDELNANNEILIPAVYLHDLINIPKNSVHRSKASEYSSQKAQELLSSIGYGKDLCSKVGTVILEHSFSRGLEPSSIESAILQDCDRLDAMGAIGIMRWASVGTKMGAAFYHLDDIWADNRDLDDKSFSLDHFPKKLLKLIETLNTEPGKREGIIRHKFFLDFLEQIKSEISS